MPVPQDGGIITSHQLSNCRGRFVSLYYNCFEYKPERMKCTQLVIYSGLGYVKQRSNYIGTLNAPTADCRPACLYSLSILGRCSVSAPLFIISLCQRIRLGVAHAARIDGRTRAPSPAAVSLLDDMRVFCDSTPLRPAYASVNIFAGRLVIGDLRGFASHQAMSERKVVASGYMDTMNLLNHADPQCNEATS